MNEPLLPRIGTVGFDGPRERTFSRLGLVEYQESFTGTPSERSLRRLRRRAGDDFTFVLRASAVITHGGEPLLDRLRLAYLPEGRLPRAPFELDELTHAAWRFTLRSAEALGAGAIFWQTPASFRPTPRSRARLARFAERHLAGSSLPIIWDAMGLWEPDELKAASQDLGLVPCRDPLLEERAFPGRSYLRVMGKARTAHGLGSDELYLLADAVEASELPWVALHTATPFRDARSLSQVVAGA